MLSVATAAATLTTLKPQTPGDSPAASVEATSPGLPARSDALWPVIDQWKRLRQSDRLPFDDYARFLMAHRGWPGEMGLRRIAERQIVPDQSDPTRIAAFFELLPPLSASGRVRYAEALAAIGQTAKARDAAAAAWTGGALSPDDENRLLSRFAGQFTQTEQDQRMERLLWDHAIASATRQLAFVTPARKPLYAARLALQTKASDAEAQVALAPGADRDAGYVIDRAAWLRDSNQWVAARTWLAQPHSYDAPPYDARAYLETLLAFARAAASDNQNDNVYGIAANAAGAFASGTDISQRPLNERDAYTSLVWLGGMTALKKLNRPRDAVALFDLYANGAQTPGSQAKGAYWAGRAAQASGDAAGANRYFTRAAANADQFYGQLATERLGRAISIPPDPPPLAISDDARATFQSREVVRAARLLGEQHQWQDQSLFVRQIANDAKSDVDHALAATFGIAIKRPDLGVMVSRNARTSGMRDPIRVGFPQVSVPPAMETHWTMIHAISRQESQFDREIVSPAGARGLMQLMNPTAKEQAGKLGLPWQPARLTEDTSYNVMLGSGFFDRLMSYYGGNYVLSVAAYNAGQGNVNKMIRANGDPRLPGVDMVDWIEAIPISETRSYVQKVLENAVVYDLFNPERARTPEKDRLSFYLGKKSAG
ncbi:lytic transglycosylase domain-containing protein [Sphingomonas sp. MMS24-J13]|uniref:lytic transglycosylase domain-containing protein n=1 Tax=Sphingomonas sp. MMS24-J13 TaxID=3238686 RepID=UPI00384B70D4